MACRLTGAEKGDPDRSRSVVRQSNQRTPRPQGAFALSTHSDCIGAMCREQEDHALCAGVSGQGCWNARPAEVRAHDRITRMCITRMNTYITSDTLSGTARVFYRIESLNIPEAGQMPCMREGMRQWYPAGSCATIFWPVAEECPEKWRERSSNRQDGREATSSGDREVFGPGFGRDPVVVHTGTLMV